MQLYTYSIGTLIGLALVSVITGPVALSIAQEVPATSTASATPAAATSQSSSLQQAPETSNGLSVQKQNRVLNLTANIANRMDAAHSRLIQITSRLERRVDKIEAAGSPVTVAQADIENAKRTLATVADQLSIIDQVLYQALSSENPQQDWLAARQVITSLTADLQTSKSLLLSAARTLQSAAPLNQATTTPGTTTTQ